MKGISQTVSPTVRGVFYTDSNSQTGWDCTYWLLVWLSRPDHMSSNTVRTLPSPSTNMQRDWQKEKNGGRWRKRRRRREAHSPSPQLCFFKSQRVSVTWRLPPERKAGVKVCRAGKVRISLGGNVQQQLRPGLSPALSLPPRRIVLHTHVPIYSKWTQSPHYIRAPSYSNAWSRAWQEEMCTISVLPVLCVYACYVHTARVPPNVNVCVNCMCVFGVPSLPRSHFESLQVLRSASLGIGYSPQQHQGAKWLMDRWLAGSGWRSPWEQRDELQVGRNHTRMHTRNAYKQHRHSPAAQGEDEGRAKTERKTLCLCRVVVANVPWSFGAISCPHKQWNAQTQTHTHARTHTQTDRHTHTNTLLGILSTQLPRQMKKSMARGERQKNKDTQREKSATTCIH